MPKASHDQENHCHLNLIAFGKRNVLVPLMMSLVSHDADTGSSGVTQPEKSHVASHLDNLELWNAIVLLMTSSASHDVNANVMV